MQNKNATLAPLCGASEKLSGIDLLRFVCAIAVLLWHYQHFSFVANQAQGFRTEDQPLYAWFAMFYRHGLYGVQVFWCISGFIFFWKYAAVLAERKVSARNFFVLRFSRLYPLHFITLLLVAAGQAVYAAQHGYYFVYKDNSLSSFGLQLGMASHWFFPWRGFSFNAPIWSVSLEVLAYVFFFCFSRRFGAGLRATLGALVVLFACKHYFDQLIFECLLFFYLGALVAIAYQRAATWAPLARRNFSALLAALLLALTGAAWKEWLAAQQFLLCATPIVIYLLLQHVKPAQPQAQHALATLGNLTYSSYLLHFPLQLSIALVCGWLGVAIPLYSPWLLLGFLGATFWLAFYCFRYVEQPLQAWIRRAWRAPGVKAPAPMDGRLDTPGVNKL